MVSNLIVLATGDNIVEDLVRRENNTKETILHVSVRNGAHQLVKDLLATDPKLACFPQEDTSPLYLAILLKHNTIAQTLNEKSENNVLSYSGPKGQNALHAAVMRGPGTYSLEACICLLYNSYLYLRPCLLLGMWIEFGKKKRNYEYLQYEDIFTRQRFLVY